MISPASYVNGVCIALSMTARSGHLTPRDSLITYAYTN